MMLNKLRSFLHVKPSGLCRPLQGPMARVVPCRAATSAGAQQVLSTRTQMDVRDSYMSYLDTASLSPSEQQHTVLFLHGNPTAAYLWRNIIPHVQDVARCVAPDLIGQGHSGKPAIQYYFREHYSYLCEWIDKMNFPDKLNFVIHDWGSALGFHWANQHRDRVASITFMEAFVAPIPGWDAWPEFVRKTFQDLRSEPGEDMVLKNNVFVEQLLPLAIKRKMSEEEMEEYIRPFKQPGEDRRPTLTWPREIPIRGDGPQETIEIVDAYNTWLSQSYFPKLYIDADPGFFSPMIQEAVKDWPNLHKEKSSGIHFLQEDSPEEIGKAVNNFLVRNVILAASVKK